MCVRVEEFWFLFGVCVVGDCDSVGYVREGVWFGVEVVGVFVVEGGDFEFGFEGGCVVGDGGVGGYGDGCVVGFEVVWRDVGRVGVVRGCGVWVGVGGSVEVGG